MSVELEMPANRVIFYHSIFLLPSIFPSLEVFSNTSNICIMWPKYWSFNINLPNGCPWLISFKIDWFDLLAVQGTLKSLLKNHNLKASILQHLTFFMVQLSHLLMTTGKTITLTMWTFVGKVMFLLFNIQSRFLIVFLTRTRQASFSFMMAVIICSDFGDQEYKICHCFHFSPFCLPCSDGAGCHDLHFCNVEF